MFIPANDLQHLTGLRAVAAILKSLFARDKAYYPVLALVINSVPIVL